MSEPRLILPETKFLQSFYEGCQEYYRHNVKHHTLPNPAEFESWKDTLLQEYEDDRLGINLPEGWVPATTFWLVDDEQWLGIGSIRHWLTEGLLRYGGHIGYGVRYSLWGKGYGTLQLKLLLEKAEELGLKKVLVTCDQKNIGSARVIEKNGGILQDIVTNEVEGQWVKTCRYWIHL